jgi:hypothetical protein
MCIPRFSTDSSMGRSPPRIISRKPENFASNNSSRHHRTSAAIGERDTRWVVSFPSRSISWNVRHEKHPLDQTETSGVMVQGRHCMSLSYLLCVSATMHFLCLIHRPPSFLTLFFRQSSFMTVCPWYAHFDSNMVYEMLGGRSMPNEIILLIPLLLCHIFGPESFLTAHD